jgi:hypothetical protein
VDLLVARINVIVGEIVAADPDAVLGGGIHLVVG